MDGCLQAAGFSPVGLVIFFSHGEAECYALARSGDPSLWAERCMRYIFTSAWGNEYRPWPEEIVREVGRFGVVVSGRQGQVGLWAQLYRKVGHWLIVLDAVNTFTSISWAAIFAGLTYVLLSLVPFVGTLYRGDPPSRFFRMDDGAIKTILSRTGAQQSDSLRVGLICVDIIPALRKLRARGTVSGGTPSVAYIDAITTVPVAITSATTMADFASFRDDLTAADIALSRGQILALLPAGCCRVVL